MDPFIGEIIMFGGNFAPRGWALCDGQLLDIASHSALFSILGTTYGGDGRTTFGLPDLRGRVPMHAGNGPGLTPRNLGQKFGAENVQLSTQEMPSHNHVASMHAESTAAGTANPQGNMLAGGVFYAAPVAADNRTMAAESIVVNNTGGSQPHNNIQPVQVVNYIIALVGTFPSRS